MSYTTLIISQYRKTVLESEITHQLPTLLLKNESVRARRLGVLALTISLILVWTAHAMDLQ